MRLQIWFGGIGRITYLYDWDAKRYFDGRIEDKSGDVIQVLNDEALNILLAMQHYNDEHYFRVEHELTMAKTGRYHSEAK